MDKFYEQLITTTKTKYFGAINVLRKICLFVGIIYTAIAAISFDFFFLIFGVLALATFFAFGVLRDKQYCEYEYIFTNGNLQIDVIYNKKRRKTLLDDDVRNFEDLIKLDGKNDIKANKVIPCIPWDKDGDKYVIISSKNQAYSILPDENLLKLIYLYNNKLMRRRY